MKKKENRKVKNCFARYIQIADLMGTVFIVDVAAFSLEIRVEILRILEDKSVLKYWWTARCDWHMMARLRTWMENKTILRHGLVDVQKMRARWNCDCFGSESLKLSAAQKDYTLAVKEDYIFWGETLACPFGTMIKVSIPPKKKSKAAPQRVADINYAEFAWYAGLDTELPALIFAASTYRYAYPIYGIAEMVELLNKMTLDYGEETDVENIQVIEGRLEAWEAATRQLLIEYHEVTVQFRRKEPAPNAVPPRHSPVMRIFPHINLKKQSWGLGPSSYQALDDQVGNPVGTTLYMIDEINKPPLPEWHPVAPADHVLGTTYPLTEEQSRAVLARLEAGEDGVNQGNRCASSLKFVYPW